MTRTVGERRDQFAWNRHKPKKALLGLTIVALGVAAVSGTEAGTTTAHPSAGAAHQFIVQGASSAVAAAEVAAVHGVTLSDLPVVHGVVAKLTAGEASVVTGDGLQVSPNLQVMVEGTGLPAGSHPSGVFTSVTGAKSMWANGVNGSGVTVAVLDTGIDANLPDLAGRVVAGVDLANSRNSTGWATDTYGHGTFVAGLIASNGQSSGGTYTGVAPEPISRRSKWPAPAASRTRARSSKGCPGQSPIKPRTGSGSSTSPSASSPPHRPPSTRSTKPSRQPGTPGSSS